MNNIIDVLDYKGYTIFANLLNKSGFQIPQNTIIFVATDDFFEYLFEEHFTYDSLLEFDQLDDLLSMNMTMKLQQNVITLQGNVIEYNEDEIDGINIIGDDFIIDNITFIPIDGLISTLKLRKKLKNNKNPLSEMQKEVLRMIAMKLEPKDLLNLCLTESYINNRICDNEDFWKEKLRLDFPNNNKPNNKSFKEYYISLIKYNTKQDKHVLEQHNIERKLNIQRCTSYQTYEKYIIYGILQKEHDKATTSEQLAIADRKIAKWYYEQDNYAYGVEASLWRLLKTTRHHFYGVKYLVEEMKMDPSADGNFAISVAYEKGHLETVKYLLKDQRVIDTLSEEEFDKYSN